MSEARTFRLTVAYDGTDFHGWQRQPGLRTVQGEIERALAGVLGLKEIGVKGAGRTDAGVHARGQVASFQAESGLPGGAFAPMLERVLPRDVRVPASAEAPAGFHARHSARSRRYVYRLLERPDVLLARFAWRAPRALEPAALAATAAPLLGRHDFSAVGAKGSSDVDPLCTISHAAWSRWEGGWAFEVTADHFLYHMVRNLVGTALIASTRPDPAAHVREVIASQRRARSGPTAPARGLCLEEVGFESGEGA